MNILIPNATGNNNLGDQAILKGLLECLRIAFGDFNLTIHSYEPESYSSGFAQKVTHSLYTWAVFENTSQLTRVYRMLMLLSILTCNYFFPSFNIRSKAQSIINDYKHADIIVYVGGGYFRSKKGLTQTLNLCMQLLLFWAARLSGAKAVVCPMSIGPFAYEWHRRLTLRVLRPLDYICVRDQLSLDILRKADFKNAAFFPDTALFLAKTDVPTRVERLFGITLREWFKGVRQKEFENEVIDAVAQFCLSKNLVVLPVVQVHGPKYGESDMPVMENVSSKLRTLGVKVRDVHYELDVHRLQKTYGGLEMLLGMRMHSDILAAVQGTPFVAIAYEHKTFGLMQLFNIEKYCLDSQEVTTDRLSALLLDAYDHKEELQKQISTKLAGIHEVYKKQFISLLKSYGN